MKAAKKPVSSAAEAYLLPKSIRSRFARMFLPAPWIEEVQLPTAKKSILDQIKSATRRLLGKADEPEKEYRRVRVAWGREITDFYGCTYHVAKDGSLRLGVAHETLPDELLDDEGKPLRGRRRRGLLRAAKLIVQRAQRRLRTRQNVVLRIDSPAGSAESVAAMEGELRVKVADGQEKTVDELAYLRHADEQSEAAALAWEAHVAGLSEEQRREYERLGLIETKAKKPAKKRGVWKRVAPDEERQCFREIRSPEEHEPDEVFMRREEAPVDAPLVATRFILAAIIDAQKPRLEASLIALAIGIAQLQNITPERIAEQYDIPQREVQQRVREWAVKLGIVRVDLTLPRYVVAHVLDDLRPRLQADCFALAFDFPLRQGVSERQLATCYGLTVAALSARVLWWVSELDARLPGVCKKRTANYRDANVRRQPANPFRQTA